LASVDFLENLMQQIDQWTRGLSRALVVVAGLLWLSASSATATTYAFTGELDPVGRAISPEGFPLEKGTSIRGTFSFDPGTPDRSSRAEHGYYHPTPPYLVELQIGDSFFFKSDLHGDYRRYNISVYDNDDSAPPTRDTFSFHANGSDAARKLGLERANVFFSMSDLTASVFQDDSLPERLMLNDFDGGILFFNFTRSEEGRSISHGLRFRIRSLELFGDPEAADMEKPPIVDHFACSDYCPRPREEYMVKIYQGVEDEEECRRLGGRPSSYTGWGTTKICLAE
jgi:hypothetical protein